MIPEDHFVASQDGWVELLSWSMWVVPHGACGSDDKDTDGLEESIGPEGSKDKVVQINEFLISIAGDRCKNVIWAVTLCGGVGGWCSEIDNGDDSGDPKNDNKQCLPDRDKDNTANSSHKLTCTFANSNSQSDSTAATQQDDEQDTSDTPTNVCVNVIVRVLSCSR